MHRFAMIALMLPLLAAPPVASAWGNLGHRIVTELAWRQLTPQAREDVRHLLAAGGDRRLVDEASWADELRHDRHHKRLWKRTRKLHYVTFENADCHYRPHRDCPDGQCVVAGLEHYARMLADTHRSDRQRLRALKFVVHLVGDIHQPLHAGYRDDAGGNGYQVQFDGKGTNLHRVWDSRMLYTRHMGWKRYTRLIANQALRGKPDNAFKPAAWAEQSCRISRTIYPRTHRIDKAYVARFRPVAEARLHVAGNRLAALLNRVLH